MLFHPFHHRHTLQGGRGDTARHIVVVTRPQELSSSSSSFPLPRLHIIIIHLNPKARSPSSRCKMEEGNGHQTEREESRVEFIATFFPSPALPDSTRSEEGRGGERLASRVRGTCVPCSFPFLFGTINTGREVGGEDRGGKEARQQS